ncbi:hypothetical protein [Luteolibacter marinus]|uniref:hypothetical protein n=1 Tax=Luteolibacter marinus TaxID=2776705 RepID=UPI001865FA59|nr:hypothetical protein [Luteolibacter marinus]
MYSPASPRGGVAPAGIFACLCLAASALAEDTNVPRGTLTVDRDLIRVGLKSQLSWDITYPTKAADLVNKDKDGNCVPKTRVRMQVRVLAAAFGNNVRYLDVDGRIIVNGSSTRIFSGDQTDVNPSKVVFDKIVERNSTISVTGFAYDYQTRPTTTYSCTTTRTDKSVVALFDGEALPSHQASMYPGMQLNALDYIANYMDAGNKANIGSDQVIFLGDFNPYGSAGYDLNDYVIIITFTAA